MIGSIAAISCGPATLDPGIDIGPTGAENQEATAHQPELKGYLHANMFLSIAFTEALGLLGLAASSTFGS